MTVRAHIAAIAVSSDIPASPANDQQAADDDPMTFFFREMSGDVEADGICAIWHGEGSAAAPLFVTTPHADPAIETVLRSGALKASQHPHEAMWESTDAGDLIHLDVATRGGRISVTAIFRGTKSKGRAVARTAVERWQPMMRAFCDLWAARRRARSRERAMIAAVNNSDAAVIMIDGLGRTLFANDCAEHILARQDGLRRNGTMLSGQRLADTLRLQATIEHAIRDGDTRSRQAAVVAMPRATGRPLLVSVIAADPPPSDERESAAMLYLFDPDQDIHPLAEPACKLYGLSPVETRLTCLLADGQSLAEAATRMRIREQTARSYLKQIFSKTSTNRQAELVQLMLKSLVRTASGRGAR